MCVFLKCVVLCVCCFAVGVGLRCGMCLVCLMFCVVSCACFCLSRAAVFCLCVLFVSRCVLFV